MTICVDDVMSTETERRVKANQGELNAAYNYAVRRKLLLVFFVGYILEKKIIFKNGRCVCMHRR